MKEGASVLGAELTESVAVSPLESDVYVSFIVPTVTARTRFFVSLYYPTDSGVNPPEMLANNNANRHTLYFAKLCPDITDDAIGGGSDAYDE